MQNIYAKTKYIRNQKNLHLTNEKGIQTYDLLNFNQDP